MGPIGCPEMMVRHYHYSLCNNSEERSSHILRGRSLKSRLFSVVCFGVHFQLLCRFRVITVTLKTVCILIKSGLGSFLQFGLYISYDILDMSAVVCYYACIYFACFGLSF